MRLEDKRRHAEAAIARLAALANSKEFSTVVSSVPSTYAMAQTVNVSPAVYLGKSNAKNLVAKVTSKKLSIE